MTPIDRPYSNHGGIILPSTGTLTTAVFPELKARDSAGYPHLRNVLRVTTQLYILSYRMPKHPQESTWPSNHESTPANQLSVLHTK